MILTLEYFGEKTDVKMGTYSVYTKTYTLNFFDSVEMEDTGLAGLTITGTWIIDGDILIQYPSGTNNGVRLRRV